MRIVEVVLLDAAGEPIPGMRVPYDPSQPTRFPPLRIETVHRIGVRAQVVTIGDTYTVTGLLSPPDGYHLSGGKETS